MALDLEEKVSPGQVTISTWDSTENAVRVNVVASTGGGDASAANQTTQIGLAEDANDLLTDILAASGGALNLIDTVYNDYSSTPVTTAAYVTLIASLPAEVKQVEIFDSSGSVLVLALGAAASEVDINQVIPGGNGLIPCIITAAARLSIKAISANATSGLLVINLYG